MVAHELVLDAARQASAEGARERCGSLGGEGSAVRRIGGGLGAEHEGAAQLRRDRASREHGCKRGCVRDAAGGHERQVDLGSHEAQQRQRAEALAAAGRIVEGAAVTAGLHALEHESIGAGVAGDARLGGRRHRRPHLAAGISQ